jgi:hypothetical protein
MMPGLSRPRSPQPRLREQLASVGKAMTQYESHLHRGGGPLLQKGGLHVGLSCLKNPSRGRGVRLSWMNEKAAEAHERASQLPCEDRGVRHCTPPAHRCSRREPAHLLAPWHTCLTAHSTAKQLVPHARLRPRRRLAACSRFVESGTAALPLAHGPAFTHASTPSQRPSARCPAAVLPPKAAGPCESAHVFHTMRHVVCAHL